MSRLWAWVEQWGWSFVVMAFHDVEPYISRSFFTLIEDKGQYHTDLVMKHNKTSRRPCSGYLA
jgi:hypothetical protein